MKCLIPVVFLSLMSFQTSASDKSCGIEKYGSDVSEEIKVKIQNKVEELFSLAEQKYEEKLIRPTIQFDVFEDDDDNPAGVFSGKKNTITFSPIYLNRYKDDFINEVVVHEVAHSINRQVNTYDASGEKDHGNHWKRVMKDLGALTLKPTHNFKLCD